MKDIRESGCTQRALRFAFLMSCSARYVIRRSLAFPRTISARSSGMTSYLSAGIVKAWIAPAMSIDYVVLPQTQTGWILHTIYTKGWQIQKHQSQQAAQPSNWPATCLRCWKEEGSVVKRLIALMCSLNVSNRLKVMDNPSHCQISSSRNLKEDTLLVRASIRRTKC
jgi:hypothetical protein